MAELSIAREDGESRGRYVATAPGVDAKAELTYSRAGSRLIIADHTGVPDAFRGQGVGRKLVQRMVEDARAQGFKIYVLCPFVKAERSKHPEWADVFQN